MQIVDKLTRFTCLHVWFLWRFVAVRDTFSRPVLDGINGITVLRYYRLLNTVEDRTGKSVSNSNITPQEAINHTCEQVERDNLSTISMN